MEGSVDLDALETLLHQLGKFLAILALAAANHRREQVEAGTFFQLQNAIDHLADGLAFDRQTGSGGIGNADTRKQKAHVIVNFRNRSDCGARIAGRGLLFDGDCRRQSVDLVDVRFLHHFQELTRVGGQAFHVPSLSFCIYGVEGE